MEKLKKFGVFIVSVALLILVSGCKDEEKSEKHTDKRVINAIDVLSDNWQERYASSWEDEEKEVEDKYLEITNTTIINIKEEIDTEKYPDAIKKFCDIDYIVEFELRSNYFESAPYYYNVGMANCVIVYKDGTTEVGNNLLNVYRSMTYSSDFTPIIDSIEEFHGEYDRVIEIEDN